MTIPETLKQERFDFWREITAYGHFDPYKVRGILSTEDLEFLQRSGAATRKTPAMRASSNLVAEWLDEILSAHLKWEGVDNTIKLKLARSFIAAAAQCNMDGGAELLYLHGLLRMAGIPGLCSHVLGLEMDEHGRVVARSQDVLGSHKG